VEGNVVYRAGGTDVPLADGGTGASLTDPNADRVMFWDDSAGAVTWLTMGTGLTITGTTLDSAGGASMTLLETLSPTSGTTISTTVSFATYRKLYVEIEGVSLSSASTLRVGASVNNGSNYGTSVAISGTLASAANAFYGWFEVGGIQIASTEHGMVGATSIIVSGPAAAIPNLSVQAAAAGAITNIQFVAGAGNFDGSGSIRIYGVK
jgi:hypothetical protein